MSVEREVAPRSQGEMKKWRRLLQPPSTGRLTIWKSLISRANAISRNRSHTPENMIPDTPHLLPFARKWGNSPNLKKQGTHAAQPGAFSS